MFEGEVDDFLGANAAVSPAAQPKAKSQGRKRRAAGERKDLPNTGDNGCFAELCEEPRLVAKRWCAKHNRAYDNMYTQAKKAGETATLCASCATPSKAQEVMTEYEVNNPDHSKFNKKHVIQWGTFKKRRKVGQVYRSRKGCKPYEFKQWLKRGTNEMGWTDTESKNQWKKWLASNVDRDTKGLDDQLRLWIPVIEEKHWDDEKAKEWELEEGGDVEKDFASKGDLKNALVNHLSVASGSSPMDQDAFFNGQTLAGTCGITLEDNPDDADPPVTPTKPAATPRTSADVDAVATPEDLSRGGVRAGAM